MKRFRFLLIIALIAAGLVMLAKNSERPHTITYKEYENNRLVITAKSGYEISIVYGALRGLHYEEKMDFGTKVSGISTRKEKSGIWKNEEFGEYSCCADGTVECGAAVITNNQTFVFNCDSEEETLKLYRILQDELAYDCEG